MPNDIKSKILQKKKSNPLPPVILYSRQARATRGFENFIKKPGMQMRYACAVTIHAGLSASLFEMTHHALSSSEFKSISSFALK
jgi:hypothetical protein